MLRLISIYAIFRAGSACKAVRVCLQRLIAEQYVQLMEWIDRTQCMVRHPSLMAAALQLTAEACKVTSV